MLNALINNFYDGIVVKLNPHVEAGKSIPTFLMDYDTGAAEVLGVISPGFQSQKEIDVRIKRAVTNGTLVLMEVTKVVEQGHKQMFVSVSDSLDIGHRDLWLLSVHIEGRNIAGYSRFLDRIAPVDLPKELCGSFDSVTFRINPHKSTGLTIRDYIQDHDGKGYDASYVCEDNYFSDDPTYELGLNLCSAANCLYATTAYWKDSSGNQMCHDAFAHDYATILKELREIAYDRNSNEEKV